MPQPLTPQPASSGFVYSEAFDTPEQRFAQLTPTATTQSVALGGMSAQVATTILAKTTYSFAGIVLTTFNSGTNNQVTVSKVVYSTPVVLRQFSQSQMVVPSNTTVWNAFNSPSSLILASGGVYDTVAQVVAVVADSIS